MTLPRLLHYSSYPFSFISLGMGDSHDGVNFMRAACVIAVEKAKSSFEPMLEVSKPKMCCNDYNLYCNVTYYATLLHSTTLCHDSICLHLRRPCPASTYPTLTTSPTHNIIHTALNRTTLHYVKLRHIIPHYLTPHYLALHHLTPHRTAPT